MYFSGYYINSIGGFLLMAISSYSIGGYWWLFY